jgi:hypothetical protein
MLFTQVTEINEPWANLQAKTEGFKPCKARYEDGVLTMRLPGGDDYAEETLEVATLKQAKEVFLRTALDFAKGSDAYNSL